MTDVNAKPRIFYTFHKGSETVATEYLTTIGEFYDPGVTVDYGQTFLGWAFDPAETDESKMYTWDQLKTKLADYWENGDPAILPGETEAWKDGEEIDVYARFKEAYYLRYMVMDTDGTVGILKSDSVRIDAADKTKIVDCEYNVSGEEFEGWIDSATGTVYENGDPLTLVHHIDLYAKLEGRYWLVFNANGTGATFTGPQLIYGNEVTTRPDDPTRKGYTFKGWNTEPDGSGDWWYNADTSVNRFGDSISQDTNLYAIWEGAPNSYTVLYWKQRATDEVGIENEDKKYDLVGSETVSTNVKTGDVITEAGLPSGWNNKTGTDYNQTHYSWNDLTANTTVAADGSTIVNVYYDRNVHHLYFQIYDYTYTATTSNSGTQYGLYNGQYVPLYYNNGTWYRTRTGEWWSGYNYSNPYSDTRYTRSNNQSWQTIRDIEALYEHNISGEFPIVGTNGVTYDNGERWKPQNDSVWKEVMFVIETMPNRNVTFRLDNASHPTKHLYYYFESLPGDEVDHTYNNTNYTLHEEIPENLGYLIPDDFLDMKGFEKAGITTHSGNPVYLYNGRYYSNQGHTAYASDVNFYYNRKRHNIIYYSNSEEVGQDTVPYEANVKSYADNHAEPTNGDDGKYFVGWYQDPDCKVPVSSDLTMPDGNVPLYAKWDTYRVRVVFVPGCTDFWFANNQQLSFRVDLGESIAFDNVKPGVAKRPGYKLVGWYYKDENGVEHELDTDMALPITTTTSGVDMTYQSSADWADNIYGDRDGAHDDVKGILKLYAKWQLDIKEGMVYFLYEVEDGYCVFDTAGNRQTYVPVDGDAHAFDTDVAIMEAPSDYIDGVDFTSWQLLNKNHGVSGIEYLPNHSLRLTESDFSDYIDVISVVDENTGNVYPMKVIRLRAKFTAQSEKATSITFDGNGGTANGQNRYTRVVPLNATVDLETESNSFTRPHHTLIGWNIKADGTGRTFATNEKIFVTNEGGSDSNILYAMWQADIEIAVTGSHKEEIFDNTQKTNGEYTHSFMLGGDPVDYTDNGEITEGGITYHQYTLKGDAAGIKVKIKTTGWPAATGTAKGAYTAADLTDEQLEDMIRIDKSAYTGSLNIKRVYEPATLIIRDLILTITKEVTGGFADMTKQFRFTLTSVQDMTTESFDYWIYRKATGQEYGPYTLNIGGSFELEDGEYIKIEGLPKGKDVIFSEENGEYTTTWKLDDGEAETGASKTVVLTNDATLAVVNRLEPPSPTGLTFPLAPYALMLAVGVLLLLLRRRRRA